MKMKIFLGLLAAASLFMGACSDSDDTEPGAVRPGTDGFQSFGTFNISAVLGENGKSVETRTPGDVDAEHRPGTNYFPKEICMLSLQPASQPGAEDVNSVFKPGYQNDGTTIVKHSLKDNVYNLYYKLEDVVSKKGEGKSNTGYILLSEAADGSNPSRFKLSVFDLEDLKNNRIPLNDFARNEREPLGSILRYSSYHPTEIRTQDERGRYVELPRLADGFPGRDILEGDYPFQKDLRYECPDQYFSGTEFLLAADDERIYLIKVVPVLSDLGGFFIERTHSINEEASAVPAVPSLLALNRLTTVINASFMLVDDNMDKSEYFVIGDEAATLANFKKMYGVDLSQLECPYAALDGVNSRFYINETNGFRQNTSGICRYVLWADGLEVTGVNGNRYRKMPERSMDVFYDYQEKQRRGYGMLGQTYSIAFPGSQADTKAQNIVFWTRIGDARVKIAVPIDAEAGIAFSQNVAHHIVVAVPAEDFANEVKSYTLTKAGADGGYVELNLSPDCVSVR